MRLLFLLVCALILTICDVQCQLLVRDVQCGQKTCKNLEYCSKLDNTCQPCSKICNAANHNFEPLVCEHQCQDYIHDERYYRKYNDASYENDLRQTVENLSRLVTISLTLICFILLILASVLVIKVFKWTKKKKITIATLRRTLFSKNLDSTTNKTSTNQEEKPRSLKLDIRASETHSDHSPVTVTTSISRRPAEDSTLDYAYDNPAMTESRTNTQY